MWLKLMLAMGSGQDSDVKLEISCAKSFACLSRNFMKRVGQKVLVNARFYFYLLQTPAHFFSSST